MLLAMDNSQENDVINFPTKRNRDIPLSSLSESELVRRAKIAWANPINMAIAGTRKLTDDDKAAIREVNRLTVKWGYAPLFDSSFENL